MKKNKPLLMDVRAPWDPECPIGRKKPSDWWRRIKYVHSYGVFWAPARMNGWTYRSLLKDLDRVCLRALKSHGALTARELAESLNREKCLRMKSERTGIHQITAATAQGWFAFASRRGLVDTWSPSGRGFSSSFVPWGLTEHGREALRSKLSVFVDRFSRFLPALIASGLLLGILEWLAVHPGALAWTFTGTILILEIAGVAFWVIRSEKREAPGVAVVAIETLRSAGRPIPAL